MKKVIGGLLVASLLSHPSLLRFDAIAYEILKSQQKIIYAIQKEKAPDESEIKKIEDSLAAIGDNSREITELMKDKKKTVAKIQTALDLKAYTRSSMNEEQIALFRTFHSNMNEEASILQEALQKIDNKKDLALAKKEILHTNADYELIYRELNEIAEHQRDVVFSLNNMIDCGQKTLDALLA